MATLAAEIVSLPVISSGSRVVPSGLCVRSVSTSAPGGISTSAQWSMASLLCTRTISCVSVICAPSGNTRSTVRSSTTTAGAA